ncbi:SGNH/GDSL hydrolase family protein [Butyrivibrio sp. YAB3001]|uniref:SGNH/GDSL hydrolase family protein n=1 Tax=Butyrivibrio sp. YAB3001 TaxID=1520812 RepID=UPI0008F6333B|nr:SGNH/GDSL hydrolase family protein [Butyrivibrio sp. YAB3001]SFC99618.1 Lysophospholipase L1 [Butyrivibrio sp. YAB3001]
MISFDREKAVAGLGDSTRFSKAFTKLENGEDVTICFLGGSITQGSLSSTPQTCYAYRVYEWLKEKFQSANISYVNAGVGGTTSVFGAARADRDVLSYAPDIVLVEFSVNDECNEYFFESYEGLVRKLLYSDCEPAVAALFNFYYQDGKSAERIHSKVTRHYGIPAASMHGAIYEDILSGKIENTELLSPDGLHPNDLGHELLAGVVTNLFERLYEKGNDDFLEKKDDGTEKKMPLTTNSFEFAKRLDNRNFEALLSGFVVDASVQNGVSDCFKNGWLGKKLHDKIVFELKDEYECSGIAVQFDRTIKRPAPVVSICLDGNEDEKIIIDTAFDQTWGDLLDLKQLIFHQTKGSHRLEIEVIDDKNGMAVPFNLVSVIINGTK